MPINYQRCITPALRASLPKGLSSRARATALACATALGAPTYADAQSLLDFQAGGWGASNQFEPVNAGGTLGQAGAGGLNGSSARDAGGGGGGGAGASGGTGGAGALGLAITPPGQNGANGNASSNYQGRGGGGGNGGTNALTVTAPIANTSLLQGGQGQNGGNGGDITFPGNRGGSGGGGGEGGYGLILNGGAGVSSNQSTIMGGAGGNGGHGGDAGGSSVKYPGGSGAGGAGGVGVWFTPSATGAAFENNGAIVGGAGGAGGYSGPNYASFYAYRVFGSSGAGGIAFYGILSANTGTIQGGDAGGLNSKGLGTGNGGIAGAGSGGVGAYLLNTTIGLSNTGVIAGGNGAGFSGINFGGRYLNVSAGDGGIGVIASGTEITSSGATAIIRGGNGGDLNSSVSDGGAGGAGGVGISANDAMIINSSGGAIQGGAGGNAIRLDSVAGAGGAGISTSSSMIINGTGGTIRGGAGGNASSQGNSLAGTGAAGISSSNTTIINSTGGTIQGGAGGNSSGLGGIVGMGGDGINGANLTIINGAAINAGAAGTLNNGAMPGAGNAITFTGGDNYLELQAGYSFMGHIDGTQAVATGGVNTLALGGSADASFDTSLLGVPNVYPNSYPNVGYHGFTVFQKTDTSTWTLAGVPDAAQGATPWTIFGGTLSISNAASLGSGGLVFDTMDGLTGTLQATAVAGTYGGPVTLNAVGTVAIDPSARLTLSGGISGSGALIKAGSGDLFLIGGNTFTGGMIVSGGTAHATSEGTAFGRGVLTIGSGATAALDNYNTDVLGLQGAGNVTLGNGTLDVNQAIDTTFSGVISNGQAGFGGALTKNGDGALTLTGVNAYTGPTTVNGGALNIDGSITSQTMVSPGGILGGNGTVYGNVSSSGTIAPGFGRQSPGSQLTINGSYSGQNGNLVLKSQLAGSDSLTDRLIIDGSGGQAQASGTTKVIVTNVGGAGAQTTGLGIPVIVTHAGGTTEASAFTLGGVAAAGAYDYLLYRGSQLGATGEDANNWYLASQLADPQPSPSPTPIYRPEAPAYAAVPGVARELGLAMLGTFHDRVGDEELVRGGRTGGVGSNQFGTGAWIRAIGQENQRTHGGVLEAKSDSTISGLQAGLDLYQTENAWPTGWGLSGEDRLGIFFAYGRAFGDVSGFALGQQNYDAGKIDLNGYSLGTTWTHLDSSGWYLDGVLMGTRYEGDPGSNRGFSAQVEGYGLTASLEGGYPISLGSNITLEPQAQVVWQYLQFDRTRDEFATIRYNAADGIDGRLGLRLAGAFDIGGMIVRPSLTANLWQELTAKDQTIFSGTPFVSGGNDSTSVEVKGGLAAQVSQTASLWGDVGYLTEVSGHEQKSWRANVGFRIVW